MRDVFTGTDIRKLQAIIDKLSDTVSNLQEVVTKLDGISNINTVIKERVPPREFIKLNLGLGFSGKDVNFSTYDGDGNPLSWDLGSDDIGYLYSKLYITLYFKAGDDYAVGDYTVKATFNGVTVSGTLNLPDTTSVVAVELELDPGTSVVMDATLTVEVDDSRGPTAAHVIMLHTSQVAFWRRRP